MNNEAVSDEMKKALLRVVRPYVISYAEQGKKVDANMWLSVCDTAYRLDDEELV